MSTVFIASAFRQLQRPASQEAVASSRVEAPRRPAGDKSAINGRPNSPSFEPPTKHARRRSLLIRGSELPVADARYQDGGEHGQTASSGAETQYATDSRPWWSSEAPVSAPVLGTFDAPTNATATAHLPLHKQHAELLYSIAQEEARCAELRGQLAVREARLAGLKQRWEDRRAERWGDRSRTEPREEAYQPETRVPSQELDVEGTGQKVEDEDDEEGDGKDRESILEETMRKLEGRKVEVDEGNEDGGEGVAAKNDSTPASSSSASLRTSSVATITVTDPTSPASSSTSSLSSTLSFGGIRDARRWLRQTISPSPEMHRCASELRPAATPRLDAVRERSVRAAICLYCERAIHLHFQGPIHVRIWTPSEMTIFAPEEEWVWAWYFVGRTCVLDHLTWDNL
ncbi:uncharacterized protein SCHCODRAFT_02601401 [Schizophyllum commune H4-8]|uniref:Uncharacterized protein n=1 Tax=Schizophyllum commune (strain H4-8 / FGSC 9210) TaxID=578458 RepID=D8QBF1_SCHCM|nr:uncharacterized protein SCHCODRAFT_02601401 [Schizophyllum commune H4-8]KAI5889151.1 hypothetical protein SCHCODRAFT_02601401 [Schizophyllum commune H4-8]